MTTASPAHMGKALAILERFRTGGRPAPADAKATAAFQKSPMGWPVSRDALAAQLAARLNYANTPRQLATSYCGPAAFLYCVLEDRPDVYVEYAVQLWKRGSYDFRTRRGDVHVDTAPLTVAGAAEITRRRASREQISDLDWMTMACLSASTRPLSGLRRGASPDDLGTSITYPPVLKRWFTAAGSPPSHDAMGLGALKSGLFPFINLMRFWRTHWIVLQIDSSFAQGGTPNTFSQRHWVVVSPHYQPRTRRDAKGPMVPLDAILPDFWKVPQDQLDTAMLGRHLGDRPLDMRLVTWGQEDYRVRIPHLADVESRYYGGYAFPRIR